MANPNVNEHGYIYGKWQNFPDTWVICYHGSLYCYLLPRQPLLLSADRQ